MHPVPLRHIPRLLAVMAVLAVLCLPGAGIAKTISLDASADGSASETSFGRGSVFYLKILVDDPSGIAGCSFTLEYDPNVLIAPTISGAGRSDSPDGITSNFPFTFHQIPNPADEPMHRQYSESGEIYFSGATIDPTDDSSGTPSPRVLFTVKFQVRPDAAFGATTLSLVQTELFDPAAGYGTDNDGDRMYGPGDTKDTVPVFVGADMTTLEDGEPANDFPILLDKLLPNDPPLQLAALDLTILYPAMASNLPFEPQLVSAGSGPVTLSVTGGDGDYTWSAIGPNGGDVSQAVLSETLGPSVQFAPLTDNYAGRYSITARDGRNGEVSWELIVPLGSIDKSRTNVLETDSGGIVFSVSGADTGVAWSIVDHAHELLSDVGFLDGDQDADTRFTPLNVISVRPFYVKAVKDQIEATASYSRIARVIPVEMFCGRIVDAAGAGLNGIELNVLDNVILSTTTVTTGSVGGVDGVFSIELPQSGIEYHLLVSDPSPTPAFLPEIISTEQVGTECDEIPGMPETTTPITHLITGRISSGGLPVDGAQVVGFYIDGLQGKVFAAPVYSDFNGNYVIELPLGWPSPFIGDPDFEPDFFVAATAKGYVPNRTSVLEHIGSGQGAADLVLTPGTPPVFARTKLKLEDSVINGQVILSISTPESPRFNGFSPKEIVVSLVDGTGLPGQLEAPVWDAAREAYLVAYNDTSESFSLNIMADAEVNDHDATDGDKITMWYDYTPAYAGSKLASSRPVELDQELGGTDSFSGDGGTAAYQIAAGAIDEEALHADGADKVVLQITEVGIGTIPNRGWAHGSGDYLYDIDLTAYDPDGNVVGTTDEKNYLKDYIIVSLPFDLEVVPPAGFESRTFVIRHAKTAAQLLQGGGAIIPLADIMATDYLYGVVTVRVRDLSVFSIGPATLPGMTGFSDSGGGGGCFIATAAYGSPMEPHVGILRKVRDVYLLPNRLGQAFVRAYYRYSPPMADAITDVEFLKIATRVVLAPLVLTGFVLLSAPWIGAAAIITVLAVLAGGGILILQTHRLKLFRKG